MTQQGDGVTDAEAKAEAKALREAQEAHERLMKRVTLREDGSALVALMSPVTKKGAKGAETMLAALEFDKFKVRHLRKVDPSIFEKNEDGEEGTIDLAAALDIATMLCRTPWAVDEIDNSDDMEAVTAVMGELMGNFLPSAD